MQIHVLVNKLYMLVHSWYPQYCCHEQHCKPISCNEIIETSTDYIWNGVHFSVVNVYPSLDAMCHACIQQGAGFVNGLCLFIQMST